MLGHSHRPENAHFIGLGDHVRHGLQSFDLQPRDAEAASMVNGSKLLR